ncbi:NAD-dependent epimerase/dehydratase family protein [Aeromicrobium marinum]|uniref:NAD-dependent epimerase/dehydratase family protein n=1 Tax=Aeromicrobium marinum TaxID=219314 RepID=UPI00058F749E|nr:NAD(P)-dependent oxidoreductase [Aeromicrobium marinum]
MRVLVTGAGGVLGRATVRALTAADHDVVGLVRTDRAAEVVEALGATPHRGDLLDDGVLPAAMQGCDAVANLATKVPVGRSALRPGSLKQIDRLRLRGTRLLVDAAREVGVRRLVQQSLSFIYADHGDGWIDEDSLVDVSRTTEPLVVAETRMARFVADGAGDAVCLRLGLVVGFDPNSAWMMHRARRGRPFVTGDPDTWMHVVHPDDVGSAVEHALSAPSGTYNIGAEPVQRRDFADVVAQAAGRREGRFVPPWVLRAGSDKLEILTRSQRVSSQRFSERTGWYPAHPKLTPDWLDDDA